MIPPVPYKGALPYIFVSYAHRDSERVWPVITRMQEAGYRVWYDEGIDPGTEWDENIATHVVGCGYFIAFLSENYMRSNNCKDELNFSRDQGKPQLLIYLEDVELPQGMAMRLGRNQAIFFDSYRNSEEFDAKLYEAQDLHLFHGSNVPPVEKTAAKRKVKTFRKKKTVVWPILAAVALIGAAVAASFLWPEEKEGVKPVPTEPVSQTEAMTEKPNLKPVSNVVIADREDMKITALATTLDSRYYTLKLSVQNKKQTGVTILTNDSYLNGVGFDPEATISVFGGEDALVELRWDRKTAQQYGIDLEKVSVIELSFSGRYDNEQGDMDDVVCTYYPYGEENVQRTVYTPTEKDVVLLETPEYMVVALDPQPHEPGTMWNQPVVYINRTDRNALFHLNQLFFNGYCKREDWRWSQYVRPHGMRFGELSYTQKYEWLAAAGGRVLQLKGEITVYESKYLNDKDPILLNQPFTFHPEGEAAAAEVLAPRQLAPEAVIGENSMFRIGYLGTAQTPTGIADLLYLENISEYFIDEYVSVSWQDKEGERYYTSENYALHPHERTILRAVRGPLDDAYWIYTTIHHYEYIEPDEDGYGGSYVLDSAYWVEPPKA